MTSPFRCSITRITRASTGRMGSSGDTVASASAHDGAQLRNVVTKDKAASTVWADSAYWSRTNEEWLTDNGLKSNILKPEPKGKPMSETTSRANGQTGDGPRSGPLSSMSLKAEGQNEALHQDHRDWEGQGEDLHGQHRLQLAPIRITRRSPDRLMTAAAPKGAGMPLSTGGKSPAKTTLGAARPVSAGNRGKSRSPVEPVR